MSETLSIDDRLLEEAQRLGGHLTKRQAVEAALRECILRRQRRQVLELFGTIDLDLGYDSKALRERRRRPRPGS